MCIIRIIVALSVITTAVDAWCTPFTYGHWHAWGPCSASCGGGTRQRVKYSCVQNKKKHQEGHCNEFCHNQGTFTGGRCQCNRWRSGKCCDDCVSNTITIPHCKSGRSICGGSPDNYKCTSCDNPYYSGGFGHGCLECTRIDNCEHRHCSNAKDVQCDNCFDDNVFYKRNSVNTKCDRMCSFDVNKCWPGSCSDELTTSCMCAPGFHNSSAKCLLDNTTKPDIVSCQTIIYGGVGKTGDKRRTPGGTQCGDLQDFYGKFQPTMLEFDMASELTINTPSPDKTIYIFESKFGVTDTTVYIKRKPLTGSEQMISTHSQKVDSGRSENVNATVYNTGVEVHLSQPKYRLTNGERLCIHYEAKGGGYVKGYDFRSNANLPATQYDKTVTTNVICYRYDDAPPQHCSINKTCTKSRSEPIQIQARIIRYSNLQVDLDGWFDPIPNGGSQEHTSGIETYTITVNEVSDGLVSTSKVSEISLNSTQTSTSLNLSSSDGQPRLYCLRLEVKDVADNLQQARRFVLFDQSTNITTDNSHTFLVTSASADTNYQWQTHHNDVCLDWKDYFNNAFYKANDLLRDIKSYEGISGVYEQETGPLPVKGTPNVHGITSFSFSWAVRKGPIAAEIDVPNFLNQNYCHSLALKDGETYILIVKSTDIVNNTYIENRTVHIDRSAPHINNLGLEKHGLRRLFAHGNTDLAKMNVSFEVLDPHSGILNVEWTFGTSETQGVLGHGTVPAEKIDGIHNDHCPDNVTDCYCPDIGLCEVSKYSISLNKLVSNRTNIGNHNRNYYFTIKATNNAKLVNIEHLDILVDDSPPEAGVIFEGTSGSPDIDYTSEDELMVNWHGFIDHESGIKEYRVGLDDHCLHKSDLFQEGNKLIDERYSVVPYTETSVRLVANFTGKKYTSIIAINNAMEPSEVVCSDGITRDDTPPKIENLRIQQGRWSESIYCIDGEVWLFTSDLKKIPLSMTSACQKRCLSSPPISDMFIALPSAISANNDTDLSDFMCLNLPLFDQQTTVFLPNDHIYIEWETDEQGSQIDDFYVGFGTGSSRTSVMSVMDYKSTHMQKYFKVNHLGVGTGEKFYAFIRTVNKAKLEHVTVIGPITIDETPPYARRTPIIKIDNDLVMVGWQNDTFYDLDQTGIIDRIFFELVCEEAVVSPLLEWRSRDSSQCLGFSGGCFKYPLRRLQKMDSDLGLNFSANVYAYNNAGHFTKVSTDTFKLPSLYPPGQAIVSDIDPLVKDDTLSWKETNLHFTSNTLCAFWKGLKHHEQLNVEIGIGTNHTTADVVAFKSSNHTRADCISSKNIKSQTQYFFLVRASCSGGVTISSSNGIEIHNESEILESLHISFERQSKFRYNIDDDSTSLSRTQFCLKDHLLIGQVYIATITNTSINITITSKDVIFIHQTFNASTLEVVSEFKPLTELPCFEVQDDSIKLEIAKAKPIQTTTSYIRNSGAIYVRWELLNFRARIQNMMSFKIGLFEVGNTGSNYSDTAVIPMSYSKGHLWHEFMQMPSQSDAQFVVGLESCTQARCLKTFKSKPFEIEYVIKDNDIKEAKIISKEGGCSDVSFTWQQFQAKSGISMYLWSISRDKAANSVISSWRPVVSTKQHIYQVTECIDLPVHGRATLFICVRGFSTVGNVITNCQLAKTETHDGSMMDKLYDIDTRRNTWKYIKQMIHSSNLGTKFTLLHDSELDFGTSNSSVAGVLIYGTERNITWYLMSSPRLPRYEQCERDKSCIHSTLTSNGFVVFDKTPIHQHALYYICAYSNVTYVERELFTETQNELRTCSNGFGINDIPPTKGTVSVQNRNGYITDINNIVITWNGFSDSVNADALGYNSGVKYYSIAIGTREGGEDLKNFTIVGYTNSITERLTNILDGTLIHVSVKATDQAGLESVPSSKALVVDTSPPLAGTLTINGRRHGRTFIRKQICTVHVERFEDSHSGIDYIEIGIGTSVGQFDLTMKRYSRRHIELTLPNELLDGHTYFITAKAINRARLTTKPISAEFIVDRSPPAGGHVIDGNLMNNKDLNYQRDLTSLQVHWRGFEDPHSGIHNYRVSLGTKPYLEDIRALLDVGILTEHVWNGTFKLGQKYYTTVEACNGAGLCRSKSSNGVLLDNSPPVAGIVKVGTGSNHEKYLPSGGSVHIQWMGFDDPQSGIDHYETCIGTSPYQCDIQPFTTCLLQSHIVRNNLNLKPGTSYYASVKALNRAGFDVTSTSDEFKIDDTPPAIVRKPSFVLDGSSLKREKYQYERSILHISWQFEDNESHIASHIVSLKTHHEGHTPVEHIHVGNVRDLTVNLDKGNWLNNGDTYFVTVSSCNVAGLCTSASSESLLIDATPPHQGGFKPPMIWNNYIDTHGQDKSNITLTWYGFFDAESSIEIYYLTVSRNYSGQELSNGIVTTKALLNETEQKATITIEQHLKPDDELIMTVWAQNVAGLNSSVARITVYVLSTVKGSPVNMHGVLEIQKHSCDVHFCNGDCTCAVIGKPCVGTSVKTNCTSMNTSELMNSPFPTFHVYAGLSNHHQSTSASSACLSGHWNTSGNNEHLVHRYEWSMGLKDQPIGEGVFDLKKEIPWNDVGKLNQAVHCLSGNTGLENDEDYVIYVKAWYSADLYAVFKSLPVHIDHTPPHNNVGKTVKDSDATCNQDYDVIDWMDTITACWNDVFSEPQGKIMRYSLSLGSTINGSDVFPRTDVGLATSFTLQNLSLSHGTKYYFTVTAFNNVGLHTSLSSDGFVVDMDTPIHGVVFNTDHYVDTGFQSSTSTFSISWHGFTDHHSGILSYFVAFVEDVIDDYTNVSFANVNLKTSHVLRSLTLQHGHSYVGLVKSIDSAGHISYIARSNPKTIDVTPPIVSTCSKHSELDSNTYSLDDDVSKLLNLTTNKYYVIKGFIAGSQNIVEPTLSIGRFQMTVPITVNNNGSIEFQHFYLSSTSGEINVSVILANNERMSQNATLFMSVSECNSPTSPDNNSNSVEVRQIGLSKLEVRCLLVDTESAVSKVELGVGTTYGGYQLRSLSSLSTSGIIEVDLVHRTQIYVTVVAYNHANLRSVFRSSPLLIDKTPPVVSDIKTAVTQVNASKNIVDIDVKWDVDDTESGIKYCLCGLGSTDHLMDLRDWTLSYSVNTCQYLNMPFQHGDQVFVSVKCINSIELASTPTVQRLTIVLDKPQIDDIRLNVVSNGAMSIHGKNRADWFVQTDTSSIKLEWSDFTDHSDIDHYEYRLTWQNETITDWNKCYMTATEVNGIDLINGRRYTAEVRAVNVGLYTSDPVYTDIILHKDEPSLSGQSVTVDRVGHQIKIDWSKVFRLASDLDVTFDVIIGSRPGFTDIIELNRVDFNKYVFEFPHSTIITKDISEMFLTITCTYSTGLYTVYHTNYKF